MTGKRQANRRGGKRVAKRQRQGSLTAVLCGLLAVLTVCVGAAAVRRLLPQAKAPEVPIEEPAPEQHETQAPQILPEEPPEPEQPEEPVSEPPEEVLPQPRFVLSFLGDCTLTSSHYAGYFEKQVGEDLDYPFSNVAEILSADDFTLANLECTFSEQRLESSSEYAFCADPKYAESLLRGSVECVTMANNHTNDFGPAGVADTVAVLERIGLPGILGNKGQCFDLTHSDGTTLRVGVYVHPFNGNTDQMKKGAAALREAGADIVIACMHAGAERIYVPTKRQTALAHAAIDGGADVVVGTHPHIVQPVETYKNGVILYSIGNFCFGGNRGPTDRDTVIPQLTAEKTDAGLTWQMTYIPCCISSAAVGNDYRPVPYAEGTKEYDRCMSKLAEPWNKMTAEEAAALAAAKAAEEAAAAPAA